VKKFLYYTVLHPLACAAWLVLVLVALWFNASDGDAGWALVNGIGAACWGFTLANGLHERFDL